MKRLAPLPKKIRESYQAWTPSSYVRDIHRGDIQHRASLDLGAVVIYRGRATRSYSNGTDVNVIAVLGDKVIARSKETIWWKGNPRYNAKLRSPLITAKEHELAEKLRKSLAEAKAKAIETLAKEKHEALASTRLAKVRERIIAAEANLDSLRKEAAALEIEAAKE